MMFTIIINSLPSKILKWKSSYHVFHDKPANYDIFHPCGCLCYYTNVAPNKDKFSPRASAAIFIGFSEEHKGYKLLDIITNKFVISRDVIFYDRSFPFGNNTTSVLQ